MTNEIEILPKLYDLTLWYAGKFGKYPKKYKYNLGERIQNTLLDILENIIEAKYNSLKKKSHFLKKVNISLEKLRFMLRMSKDLQCINLQEYEFAIKNILEIGKMIGGWLKFTNDKSGTNG